MHSSEPSPSPASSPPPSLQIAAARTSALAHVDRDLATLVVSGGDRVLWLNGLLTCNLAALKPGVAAYGLAVTQKGRILADVIVVADGERMVVVVPGAERATLRAALDHYLVMEDVEIVDGTDVVYRAHGPRSAEVARAAADAGALTASFDATGLGGAVMVAPAERAGEVEQAMQGALRAAGGELGDDAGWEALRLERGVPRFGRDFDVTTYPQEAALEKRAVAFDKGCYLGQEVVCMLEMRGHVKRKLVPLVVEGGVPAPGADVVDEAGAKVGHVTSSAFSPTLGTAVALAMLKAPQAVPGTVVRLGSVAAKVTEVPAP